MDLPGKELYCVLFSDRGRDRDEFYDFFKGRFEMQYGKVGCDLKKNSQVIFSYSMRNTPRLWVSHGNDVCGERRLAAGSRAGRRLGPVRLVTRSPCLYKQEHGIGDVLPGCVAAVEA